MRKLLYSTLLAMALSTTGCASLFNAAFVRFPMGGVALDTAIIYENGFKSKSELPNRDWDDKAVEYLAVFGAFVDWAPSLALDIVLLPWTVPATIFFPGKVM